MDAAVADSDLGEAMSSSLGGLSERRNQAFASHDFEGPRQRVNQLKRDALARLPELLDEFTREAEATGAHVHLAATPEDACQIVLDIARQHEAKLAVKSKSMVTEEIHLNHVLEKDGIRVVETDLGEWIIQLLGDTPSHLIAPAIHVNQEQVRQLLSVEAGEQLPNDPEELVQFARKRLRQEFIDADIGISGANIAIAESGTLVIVTNEGNGRLVTTLPPVHIAVLGIEKIVPSLEDAAAILRMLPRSGTGQKLSVYVSFITGPSKSADIGGTLVTGAHGPKYVHIVLLDNGREEARRDPEMRSALQCIRCGACSNVCPPYKVVGGHVFGHIYTGPIGLVMTAMHHGLDKAAGPQSLCVSCNACEMVCPAEIPIPELILNVRARVTEQFGMPRLKEMAIDRWSDPASGQRWAGLASLAAQSISVDGSLRHIPFRPDLTEGRTLTSPARTPLRKRVKNDDFSDVPILSGSQAKGLSVAYFPGCMIDRLAPEMGEAVMTVLAACGCKIDFPENQHCCGLVALNVGDRQHGRAMAKQTIEMLERVDADYVLTNSTSCLAAISQDYQTLFRDDLEWLERAQAQAGRLVEFTTFITDIARLQPEDFSRPSQPQQVTYHDACQSSNALGLGAPAREIITNILGLELIEMVDSNVCCGFGGSFSVDYPRLSTTILGKKLANATSTGAAFIVSDNPGCLLQIRGGLEARGSSVRALHIAELVARSLPREK